MAFLRSSFNFMWMHLDLDSFQFSVFNPKDVKISIRKYIFCEREIIGALENIKTNQAFCINAIGNIGKTCVNIRKSLVLLNVSLTLLKYTHRMNNVHFNIFVLFVWVCVCVHIALVLLTFLYFEFASSHR